MSAFVEAHYGLCLIGAIVLGLVIGVVGIWWLVRRAAAQAVGRGLNW